MRPTPQRLWPGREDIDRARLNDERDERRFALACLALCAVPLAALAWLLFS